MNTRTFVALAVAGLAISAFAEEFSASPVNNAVARFEFDNDSVFGSDDAFSAGWSLQYHGAIEDTWRGPLAPFLANSGILGDDGAGGRVVRRSMGITQLIATPEDLSIAELQPDDVPYAGVLGVYHAWAAYDNRRLAAVQLYAGYMGPDSCAEDVQKFVHNDMGLSDADPKGWDNQLDKEWLGNVNLAWRWKLFAPADDRYQSGRWASDLSVGGQLAAGNAAQFADAQVECRFGPNLPMGFTPIPDPPPRGVALDPVYPSAAAPGMSSKAWHGYLSIILRGTAIDELIVREGGNTANGLYHPGAEDADSVITEAIVGLHLAWGRYTLHLTGFRMISGEAASHSDSDWLNLSLDRRF